MVLVFVLIYLVIGVGSLGVGNDWIFFFSWKLVIILFGINGYDDVERF